MDIYKYVSYGISVEFDKVFNVSILQTDYYSKIETLDKTREFIGDSITMITIYDNDNGTKTISFYKYGDNIGHQLMLSTSNIIPEAYELYMKYSKNEGVYIENRSAIKEIWQHYKKLVY